MAAKLTRLTHNCT